MPLKIQTSEGWTEVIIVDNCDFDRFYAVAAVLQEYFNIAFIRKLNDFDSIYWDFEYKGSVLTIYYNVFLWISIFPKLLREAKDLDNENVVELSTLINAKLDSLN